jgi:hypothetical protein
MAELEFLGPLEEKKEPEYLGPLEPESPPGVLGTIANVGRNVVAGTLDTAASFMSPAIAPTIGAEETMLEKTRGKIKGWAEDVAAPKTTSKAYDYPIEAVRSTTRSLTNLVPFALARGKGTPLRNRLIGAVGGKGAMFGIDEYTEFMLDARNEFKKQGLSNEEIEQTLAKVRPYAGASGAAEIAGEWTSDILTARVFGLLGDATVKPAVKQTLGRVAANYAKKFGISALGEVGGETGTTVAQHYAREGAGLPTGSLKDEIIDTIGVTLWQTLYQGTISSGVNRARQRAIAKIAETYDVGKEEAGTVLDEVVQQAKDTVAEKPAAEQLDLSKAGEVNEAAVAEMETLAKEAEKVEAEEAAVLEEAAQLIKATRQAAKSAAVTEAARNLTRAEKIEEKRARVREKEAADVKKEEVVETPEAEITNPEAMTKPKVEEPTMVKISPKGQTPLSKASALAVLKQKGLSDEDAVVFYNMRSALGDLDNVRTVEDFDAWYDKDTEPEDWASALGGENAEGLRGAEEEVLGRGTESVEGETEGGKNLEQPVQQGEGEPTSREKRKAKRQTSRKVKEVKESGEGKVETKAERKGQEAAEEVENEGEALEDAIYESRNDAELALGKIDQEVAKDYVIIGDKNEFYIQHKRHLPTATSEKAVGIPTNPLYKTAEETAQETLPQDDSLDSGLTRLVHDINNWFHISEDVDELQQYVDLVVRTLSSLETNARDYLEMFNGDVIAYDKWVDKLNRLAGYISDISRVKLGNRVGALETSDLAAGISEIFGQEVGVVDSMRGYSEETMDFMGMQKAYEMLVEIGRRVYDSASNSFQDWMLQMRAYLSNVWTKVKPYMLQIWDSIPTGNNITLDFMGLQKTYEILAMHGTGRLFDRFSTKFMKSGSGATSFGWGLYFTSIKEIAKRYAEDVSRKIGGEVRFGKTTYPGGNLTGSSSTIGLTIQGVVRRLNSEGHASAISYLLQTKENLKGTYREFLDISDSKQRERALGTIDRDNRAVDEMIEAINNNDYDIKKATKVIYQVKLSKADKTPLNLLDWYEEVPKEQMDMVLKAAEENVLLKEGRTLSIDIYSKDGLHFVNVDSNRAKDSRWIAEHIRVYLDNFYQMEKEVGREEALKFWTQNMKHVEKISKGYITADMLPERFKIHTEGSNIRMLSRATSGQDLYQMLTNILGQKKHASLFLKDAGIDGNVYPVGALSGGETRRYRTTVTAPGMSERLKALLTIELRNNERIGGSISSGLNAIRHMLEEQIEDYRESIKRLKDSLNNIASDRLTGDMIKAERRQLELDIEERYEEIHENNELLGEMSEYELVPEKIKIEKKLKTKQKVSVKSRLDFDGFVKIVEEGLIQDPGLQVDTPEDAISLAKSAAKTYIKDYERQLSNPNLSSPYDRGKEAADSYRRSLEREVESYKRIIQQADILAKTPDLIEIVEEPTIKDNYVIFDEAAVDIEGHITLGFLGLQGSYETLTKMYSQWKQRRTWHRDREERYVASDQKDHTIHYVKDKDISGAWTWFMHAMMPAHKGFSDLARKIVVHIGQAKLWTNHQMEIEREFIEKNVASKLDKKQRRDAQTLGLAVERYSRVKRKEFADLKMSQADIDIQTKAAVAAYIAGYQEADQTTKDVYQFARDEFFEKMRKKYIDHMIRQAHYRLSTKYKSVIDGIEAGISPQQVFQQLGITKAGEIRKALAEYKTYKEDINSIKNWGTEDYWTHMMVGDIIVTEKTGKSRSKVGMVIAAAPDIDLAMERAKKYIEEKTARGETVGDISIREGFAYQGDMKTMLSKRKYILVASRLDKAVEKALKGGGQTSGVGDEARRILRKNLRDIVGIKPSQVFAAPTMETKNLLMGEDDIVDAMSMYAYAMHKKMAFDPVIAELQTAQDKLGGNEYSHLEAVLDDAKGKYYLEDRILDATISTLTGGAIDAHRAASKTIDRLRNATVMAKLGYRPVAGLLNGADAYSRIAMQLGVKYLGRAQKLLMSNTAEKRLVDKYSWALGARAFEQGGTISGGVRVGSHVLKGGKQLITPLGMFNLMELPARRANFLAAYLYSQDMSPGLSEREHADFATLSVWTLQGANLVSMMPRIMRSPTGRLLTLFQPFVARTVEWMIMNASSPAFWAKFLCYTAAVAGPRGLIAMAKTLPLIAFAASAMGGGDWWDKLEEYLQRKWGGYASGVPGAVAGVDVVGPATIQLPSVEKDLLSPLGPVVSSVHELYNIAMAFNPAETVANRPQIAKAHLKKAVPAIRNIWDVIDSYYDKEGFVYNEKGDPVYNLDSKYDKAVVAFGAKPVSKSYMETLSRIETKAQEIERKHVSQILSEYSNEVRRLTNDDYRNIREDDPRIESAWNRMQEKIADYRISPESLESAASRFAKKPGVRLLLRTRQTRQAETLEKLEEAGPMFGVDFLR